MKTAKFFFNKRGFTFIELIVAMVVFAILGSSVAGLVRAGLSSYGQISNDMQNETQARTALSLITVQIRQHDAIDAITTGPGVIRLKDEPPHSAGTVVWVEDGAVWAAEVSDVGLIPDTDAPNANKIAEIYSIHLDQGITEAGTGLEYTITVSYGPSGEKSLSQKITQRSDPALP